MKLLKRILLPTDFEDASHDALGVAIYVAKIFGSQIVPIHVIQETPDLDELTKQRLRTNVDERLEEVRERIRQEGVECGDPIVARGAPFEQIMHHGNALNVNVIMVGAGRKTDRGEMVAGITPQRVVRRSTRPIWLVAPGSRLPVNQILAPVDCSNHSRRALRNAIHLARQFRAKLAILTVAEPLPNLVQTDQQVKKVQRTYVNSTQARFDRFCREFDIRGVEVSKLVRQGRPAEQILHICRETNSDLLVMGSAGRTGLARLFIGSVAEKVLRQLPCSAITVKSEQAIRLEFDAEVNDAKACYQRGMELLEKGFAEEAIGHLETVIKHDRMSAPGWEALADAHHSLGHEEAAEECRRKAKYIRDTLWQTMVQSGARRGHFPWEKT